MPIHYFTLILALCSTITLSAQSDKIKLKARVSPAPEIADDLVPKSVVQTNDGRTLLVFKARNPELDEKAAGKAQPKFELYDAGKLTMIRDLNAPETLDKEKVHLEEVLMVAGEPVLIGTIRDLKSGGLRILYTRVDQNLTRAGRPFEEIAKFDTGLKGSHVVFGRASGKKEPLFATSPDGTTILFVTPEVRDTVSGAGVFLLTAFGADMQPKWAHAVAIEEGAQRSDIVDAAVDDDGNSWLLVRYDHKGRSAVKQEVESEIKLFRITADGINGIRFGLDAKQYVTTALLHTIDDGKLICAGHAASSAAEEAQPVFFIADVPSAGGDLSDVVIVKDPFKTQGRKVEVRDILQGENGDTFLVIEEYAYSSIPHPKTLKHAMKHVRGTVHVMNVGTSGQLKWSSSVPRLVHADGPYFGNVHAVVFGSDLALFMLDSDKMVEKRSANKEISPADMIRPYTVHYQFTEKGEMKPKKIFESGSTTLLIAGKQLYPIGADRYMAFGSSKFESGNGFVPVDMEFSR